MITANDIKIKHFSFDGSMHITVQAEGNSERTILLPATALMKALEQSGQILEHHVPSELVRRSFNHPWLSLSQFLESNMDYEMAEKLAVRYLNDRADKPVKP